MEVPNDGIKGQVISSWIYACFQFTQEECLTCQVLGHLLQGDLWLLPSSPCLLVSLMLMAFLGLISRFQEGPFMPDLMEMTAASAQSLRLSDSWKLWLFPLLPALNEMVFHGLWVLTLQWLLERWRGGTQLQAQSAGPGCSGSTVLIQTHPLWTGNQLCFLMKLQESLLLYLLSLPPCLISSLCPLLTALELQPSISP